MNTEPAPSTDPGDDPFATALRQAVRARGLSLDRIRYHLARRGHDVSMATLSYWQSGRSRPERATSVAALADLEAVLQVEPGALADALGASKGRPVVVPREVVAQQATPAVDPLLRDQRAIGELVGSRDTLAGSLGCDVRKLPRRLSVHVRAHVRATRTLGRRRVREVIVAPHDDFRCFPVGLFLRAGAGEVSVVGDVNCRVSALARSKERPDVAVAVLELDSAMQAGEQCVVEYRIDPLGAGDDGGCMYVYLDGRTELCVFDVQFTRGDLPVAITFTARKDGREKIARLPVAGERQSAAAEQVGPGAIGVSWWW